MQANYEQLCPNAGEKQPLHQQIIQEHENLKHDIVTLIKEKDCKDQETNNVKNSIPQQCLMSPNQSHMGKHTQMGEKGKCLLCEAFVGDSYGEKIMHYKQFHPKMQFGSGKGVRTQVLSNPRKILRTNNINQSQKFSDTESMESDHDDFKKGLF